MSKKTYYSRAQYVLAHGLIQSFFQALPALLFLSDPKNERKLFERYIQWGPYAQNWTYWQRSLLLNLYEKQRSLRPSPKALFSDPSPHSWGLLLKYYLYSAHNPAFRGEFLQAHPFLDEKQREAYNQLSFQDFLPDFQKTLQACSEPSLPRSQPTLLFSSVITSYRPLSFTQGLEEAIVSHSEKRLSQSLVPLGSR